MAARIGGLAKRYAKLLELKMITSDNDQTSDQSEMIDAIRRSGYLIESQISEILSSSGFFVEANYSFTAVGHEGGGNSAAVRYANDGIEWCGQRALIDASVFIGLRSSPRE